MDNLLKEAENLGILNIDVNNERLTPEIIKAAIDSKKRLNTVLNKDKIKQKLQEADRVVAAQHR